MGRQAKLNMRFEDTNLIPELLKAVSDAGYEAPTRIQEDTIPLALMGRDVLGCAQTGTGKTAAFALPILQRLYRNETALYGDRTAGSNDAPSRFSKAFLRGAESDDAKKSEPAEETQYAQTMDEAYGRVPKNGGKEAARAKARAKETDTRKIRALILTPTRELALQIGDSFTLYGKNLPLRTAVIFGGVSQIPQTEQLKKGVDVLVATPGRLNDLIGQGYISLAHLEIFVLDEADRMLDMGFIHDVRRIMNQLPPVRQTLLFSATMPMEVEKLALDLLYQPITVKVNPPTSTVDKIHQTVYFIDKANKRKLLLDLLKDTEKPVESALVFVRTKHGADRVARDLVRGGVTAKSIHGDKSQGARQDALAQFKSGRLRVLVATDIAARGIDIFGLSHVYNYDVPNEAETYIHRIGRTGRAGLTGEAGTFCCYDELERFRAVEKLIGMNIEEAVSPYPMQVFTSSGERIGRPPIGSESRRGKPERGARNSENRKNGRDKKRSGRSFPKEEWFDPDTEQVLETVDASPMDDAKTERTPSNESGEKPKRKRSRRRKKKVAEGAMSAGSGAPAESTVKVESAEKSAPAERTETAAKPAKKERFPKKAKAVPSENGAKEEGAKEESRNDRKKKNKPQKENAGKDANAEGKPARKERRPFHEHTKIEDRGNVLKHLPKKRETPLNTEPDDDFMPAIVFKNNARNDETGEPKKGFLTGLLRFGKKEEAKGPAPTDELNKDVIETRVWQGSRGARPKVVDRRNSDDDEL